MRNLLLALVAVIPLACGSSRDARPDPFPELEPEKAAPPFTDDPGFNTGPELGATCDATRRVGESGLGLVVRDPEVLARFELKRVLGQILSTANRTGSPEAMLQRIFDTDNTTSGGVFADAIHCDTAGNRAFTNGPAAQCPRAEGALAKSKGLFTPGDPDYFAPVALVHRFDLIGSSLGTCGEYRIVFAKTSGRTDPKNRVFLIFEAALVNPKRTLAACRPIADRLALWEKDPDRTRVANDIDLAYFGGGDGLPPIVHANSFGFQGGSCTYAGDCGQIRLGQGMETPWEFRELRLLQDGTINAPFQFKPTTVKSSPVPAFFTDETVMATSTRSALTFDLANLGKPAVPLIATSLGDAHNGGVSAMSGTGAPDYLARVAASPSGPTFLAQIAKQLEFAKADINAICPANDPLTPTSILQRFAAVSCAGCHAPEKFIGADRKIGCGLIWPKSLGETHIDESGNLSEALREVFLPHRARVLTTYLQACDVEAVRKNLAPSFGMNQCFAAGTMITMADGTKKAIEKIEIGDRVLSYDEKHAALVTGEVTKTFVHPNTDHLVTVNGSLATTANHPFYSNGRWVPAEDLDVGAPLFVVGASGSAARTIETGAVSAIQMRDGTATTYNFTVAEHHDYFAGGYLVHNKK